MKSRFEVVEFVRVKARLNTIHCPSATALPNRQSYCHKKAQKPESG
jgi:hypothetical protein